MVRIAERAAATDVLDHPLTRAEILGWLRETHGARLEDLWRQADVQPRDVKVAQIYDAFTPLIPFSLEAFGFCKQGEGGAFTENGAIEMGGRLPVNTSGGSLSEAYIHGMNLVIEGVRQIRGTSTAQVPNADVCLVTSAYVVPTSGVLLRR